MKRILKVQHPMLQLHVLKLIKSQVPFCGRKWRQCTSSMVFSVSVRGSRVMCYAANMQVITAIYLNCRPDLRDEWLIGPEGDDALEAQVCHLYFHVSSSADDLSCRHIRHKSKHCVIWSSFVRSSLLPPRYNTDMTSPCRQFKALWCYHILSQHQPQTDRKHLIPHRGSPPWPGTVWHHTTHRHSEHRRSGRFPSLAGTGSGSIDLPSLCDRGYCI